MARWSLAAALVLAVTAGAGCSGSRSSPALLDGGRDSQLVFPDGRADLFVAPPGSALAAEISSGGGTSSTSGGEIILESVVGPTVEATPMSGGGATCQWYGAIGSE
jgi:hypothetical protein